MFSKQRDGLITDDELRALQNDLIMNPLLGAAIVGTGGLRKVRLAFGGKGKSGGCRVIYLHVRPDTIYLLLIYPKGRKDTLTNEEKNQLKALAETLKNVSAQ